MLGLTGTPLDLGILLSSWPVLVCHQVLYLDAMEYFPDELQEILDVMTEKELRVRLPLEELELLLED